MLKLLKEWLHVRRLEALSKIYQVETNSLKFEQRIEAEITKELDSRKEAANG